MTPRIDHMRIAPEAAKPFLRLVNYLASSGLEHSLLELVKIRASQLNGCAYCLDMHTKDARASGETEQRIYLLSAWRESPFYSERECAALAWTEAVTQIASGVPDDVYDAAREQFSEKELVDLTWSIALINGWNRMAVSLRSVPGTYQPAQVHAASL